MKTNDNEKTMTMEENGEDLAPLVLDQRLKQEINILKLEGSLFCFDPKEAKRRRGKLTLSDARKLPVTVDINPNSSKTPSTSTSAAPKPQRASLQLSRRRLRLSPKCPGSALPVPSGTRS